MKRKSIIKNVITAMIAGVLTLGMSVSGYGEAASSIQPETTKIAQLEKGHKGRFNLDLTKFVEDGTISKEQADKINALLEQKKAEKRAEMEKVKSMTEEEKKAYFEQKKATNKKSEFFSELVSSGVITQAQADKIHTSLKESAAKKGCKFDVAKTQEQLKTQVDNGTITQEQSDKIITFLNKKIEERKALLEKFKNMSEEEKKSYFEANKDKFKHTDLLAELVSSNTITQEQADALSKVLFNCDNPSQNTTPNTTS
ncbi:MAG: hypothetical protein AB6733_17450 [Clostridiaceae bacterium]